MIGRKIVGLDDKGPILILGLYLQIWNKINWVTKYNCISTFTLKYNNVCLEQSSFQYLILSVMCLNFTQVNLNFLVPNKCHGDYCIKVAIKWTFFPKIKKKNEKIISWLIYVFIVLPVNRNLPLFYFIICKKQRLCFLKYTCKDICISGKGKHWCK